MPQPFVITKDARSAQMHVRRRDDGACVGCIEVGLYEIVRSVILTEREEGGRTSDRLEEMT